MAYEDKYSELEQYLRAGEPDVKERARNWSIAIGLQAVDGLKPSEYLYETAQRNIEGKLTFDEVKEELRTYYMKKVARTDEEKAEEEADKVSANIAKLLSSPTFAFTVVGLIAIHRHVFDGVFKFAGKLRDVDITKKEWVLGGGASVSYQPAMDLKAAIEYDLNKEKDFDYSKLSTQDAIGHLARFIADLWQIHPFREGNTRTTAVFLIKYLRSMGIAASNDMFKRHSWYFRNALVRASYKGLNVSPTTVYVELFLRNLILGENNELRNRDMLVTPGRATIQSATPIAPKSKICTLNCTLEETSVLRIIKDNPKITQKEIAEAIGKSARTVKSITSALVEKGIIVRRNGRRNGWWEVISGEDNE